MYQHNNVRFIMIVISSLFALSMLIACGTPTPEPTPKPLAEELIFYDWEEDMPLSVLDKFTEEYGVKVTYKTYEDQELAVEGIRNKENYDVVVLENINVSRLMSDELLAELNHQNVTNIKNIALNFRELAYDPGNKYSVPYGWGATGLVVRNDLVTEPIVSWESLWDPQYAGKVGIWEYEQREVMAMALKTLGHSVNTKNPDELTAAKEKLLALKPNVVDIEQIFTDDSDEIASAPLLLDGQLVIAHGWADDVLQARAESEDVIFVIPEEGPFLWGDNFVIPANSPNKETAELFLNFLLRPEIAAEIVNENYFATANEASFELIDPEIYNDPLVFPANEQIQNGEVVVPLDDETQALYDEIWQAFLDAE
ncbi:spermidine/putrescine ABC transporter substrate-binding protein [Anaerolineales bacterium HSG6]|nr:spermidine/putrescine ABC transporter substrate-binding protein [Anaerolineales bacterium HSG6]